MTSPTASTIIFVDSHVDNYQSLISSIPANTEVVVIDATNDGLKQITSALAGRSGVESIQILSHGDSGQLQLGSIQLNSETLSQYTDQLQSWSSALTDSADILLYGCNVAAGDSGSQFTQQLATLTGADVAASTDLTGNAALGGDWDLEAAIGQIETSLTLDRAAMEGYGSTLAVLFAEDFTGEDVTSRPWRFGRGVTTSADPFLTARGTVAPSENGLPGTENPIDAPGEGALRLTGAETDQAAFVIYNQAIPSNAGLSITFDLFSYGGTGADGISFFLIDGRSNPSIAGGFGGSLGYAQRTTPLDVDGLRGGYIGIGFDEFGNFSSGTEGRVGGPGRRSNSVAIRGSEATDYRYLTGNSSLPERLDNPDATSRDEARRRVNVELNPSGLVDVRVDFNGDNDFNDQGEVVIDSFDVVEANGSPLPGTFKFGFASSTGNSTNIHEIRTFQIDTTTTEDPNLPPIARNTTAEVEAGSVTRITRTSGIDRDGTVTTYIIRTLPSAGQGTLFFGEPGEGGRRVTVGQELTPTEVRQLYFRSNSRFSEASFTFDVVDNDEEISESPGTVSLVLPPGEGPNAAPTAADRTLEVSPETTTRLISPLSATDSDGAIAFYTIATLPQANQGSLFLGNPASGGRRIRTGDRLTTSEIGQIFFQATDNFTGGSFTYTATDDDGARTASRATVTLNSTDGLPPGSDPPCGPGVTLTGNAVGNTLEGGDDGDTLSGLGGNDILRGFGCDDILDGGTGADQLVGGAGNDFLRGGSGNDNLQGGTGQDFLRGEQGDDVLRGGDARDRLYGEEGSDIIEGDDGNDLIRGGSDDDTLRGEDGRDGLIGGGGDDRLSGGADQDNLRGGTGNDVLFGGDGFDRLYGQDGRDVLEGEAGNDLLRGGNGNDILRGEDGSDRFLGGAGNDRMGGGLGNDIMRGGSGDDYLLGTAGRDILSGGTGDDVLVGGVDADRVICGPGRDLVLYSSYEERGDIVTDFSTSSDRLDIGRIFDKPGYSLSGRAAFDAYVRLTQVGADTALQIRPDGDRSELFATLSTLRNVNVADFSRSNFVL